MSRDKHLKPGISTHNSAFQAEKITGNALTACVDDLRCKMSELEEKMKKMQQEIVSKFSFLFAIDPACCLSPPVVVTSNNQSSLSSVSGSDSGITSTMLIPLQNASVKFLMPRRSPKV